MGASPSGSLHQVPAGCVPVALGRLLGRWSRTEHINQANENFPLPITHGWRAGFHKTAPTPPAKLALSSVRLGMAGLTPPCPSLSHRVKKSLRKFVFMPLSLCHQLCSPTPALCPASFCPLHSWNHIQGCVVGGHSQATLLTLSCLESPSETQLCPHTQACWPHEGQLLQRCTDLCQATSHHSTFSFGPCNRPATYYVHCTGKKSKAQKGL